jgi:hypothetical protein
MSKQTKSNKKQKATKPRASKSSAGSKDKQESARSKSAVIIELLGRPEGASLEDMTLATGWQAHSVRGFLSGTLKKKMGRSVTSSLVDGVRRYRAEASGGAA